MRLFWSFGAIEMLCVGSMAFVINLNQSIHLKTIRKQTPFRKTPSVYHSLTGEFSSSFLSGINHGILDKEVCALFWTLSSCQEEQWTPKNSLVIFWKINGSLYDKSHYKAFDCSYISSEMVCWVSFCNHCFSAISFVLRFGYTKKCI